MTNIIQPAQRDRTRKPYDINPWVPASEILPYKGQTVRVRIEGQSNWVHNHAYHNGGYWRDNYGRKLTNVIEWKWLK